ncbi:hypothetical protein [Kitasatospora sp. NBC_01302]|uniref:hypothetical protein n=1 Tax=Kitasatospora sp. NBC_01302 TaxID=2903575 RepID=UPI002E0E17F9|nr:hypothetical protein OG294_13980 [Kitasatospora sp. NBC_01302]
MTTTPRRLDQRLALRDRFRDILATAQAERHLREDVIDGELEWVAHERTTMHRAVNKARAELGKQPLPISAVEAVEQQAVGHSDYSSKYAPYCAELVQEKP